MNYQANIKNTYNVDIDSFSSFSTGAIAFLESGEQYLLEASPSGVSYDYDAQLYYYVNVVHRELPQDEVAMLLVRTPDTLSLCCSTKVDYVLMNSTDGYVISATSLQQNGTYYEIGDGVNLYNYPQFNPNSIISDFTYGQYYKTFDSDYAIYDFSSVQNVNLYNYRSDSLYLRGENLSFYNSYLSFYELTSSTELTISYGSPIFEQGNVEYERGYNNGYQGGFVNGYDGGYNDGLTMGGIDGHTANAFTYIGGAFQAVSSIMALEVLPHITIGLCFSIPLVLTLIMVMFRLVKK